MKFKYQKIAFHALSIILSFLLSSAFVLISTFLSMVVAGHYYDINHPGVRGDDLGGGLVVVLVMQVALIFFGIFSVSLFFFLRKRMLQVFLKLGGLKNV